MKIFDLHADIGHNLYQRWLQTNESNLFAKEHDQKLRTGEITYTSIACFFVGDESWEDMQNMILKAKEEIQNSDVKWILNASDLDNPHELNCIITVEGMCGIKDDVVSKIHWMYDQGVRIASLCWNDENTLATGVRGNPSRGLSEAGRIAIRTMNELNMIVDVSHTNEKCFWDILEISSKPVIATHSNLRCLANVDRNLTNQQCVALYQQGGLIGLNAARKFIDSLDENQDSNHLASHAKKMSELASVDCIAIGFDFMDFEEDFGVKAMASDLKSALQAQNLIKGLRNYFSEDEVEKIAYKNAIDFLKKNL